jgi:hypothetical protein
MFYFLFLIFFSQELQVIFPDIPSSNEAVDSLGSTEQYCVQLPGMFNVEKNSIGLQPVVNVAKVSDQEI